MDCGCAASYHMPSLLNPDVRRHTHSTHMSRPSGNAALNQLRRDPKAAARVFGQMFPDARDAEAVMHILSDAIKHASRASSSSWGLSLFPNRVCLNVGRGAVLQLLADSMIFIVTGRRLRALSKRDKAAFVFSGRDYNFVPDAVEGWLNGNAQTAYRPLAAAHHDLIERAARNRKVCFWPDSHSPSFVALMRKHGFVVPDPEYPRVSDTRAAPVSEETDPDEEEFPSLEGRALFRKHLSRERNSRLAKKKKTATLARTGRLACEVCGFDFERTYGAIGHFYAEAHHELPLSALLKPTPTRLSDLAIVCSNCHRMLHRGNPLYTLDELRAYRASAGRDA